MTAGAPLDEIVQVTTPEFWMSYPHATYTRLRTEEPVFWSERDEVWVLSRYDDIRAVSRQSDVFSNGYGIMANAALIRADNGDSRLMARAEARRQTEMQYADSEYIAIADRPRHTYLRKLVADRFSAAAVADLDRRLQELSEQVVARIEPDVEVDFIDAAAAPLPMLVLADLFGVPAERIDDFRRWADSFIDLADASLNTDPTVIARCLQDCEEFNSYFTARLEAARRQPGSDLLSTMAQQDPADFPLHEQLAMVRILLVAGDITTRSALADAALLLSEHPAQLQLLVDHPDLIPNAVDEVVRMSSPVTHMCRTALRTTTIGAETINPGDFLVLAYQAANRDEAVWENSQNFDVRREPLRAHVAFGFATHYCLGAHLARREIRAMLAALVSRFSSVEVTGELERCRAFMTPAIKTMPVVLRE
jgi:cytochrome P450